MLLTYSSLISAADSGASRLQQLVDWCKPNFEGLIVFDGMPRSFSTASLFSMQPVEIVCEDSAGQQWFHSMRVGELGGVSRAHWIVCCCRVPQGKKSGAREWRQADQGWREGAAAAAHAPAGARRLLLRHR